MLVQLQIANADGKLKPGEYLQAKFDLPAPTDVVTLPSTALLYRAAGPQVAVVGPDGRVKLRKVGIAKDLGAKVQIATGLTPGQKVIDNPPDALLDGDKVKVVESKKAPARG